MRVLARLALAALLLGALLPGALAAQQPESHFFTTSDGVRIHYITKGDQGSWVMLVHGFTSTALGNWGQNGIIDALAENHRVVAIDTRNHGQSAVVQERGPGSPLEVVELLEHLGIERVHLHGYSMGGFITSSIVASHPELLITASYGGAAYRPGEGVDVSTIDIPMLALNGENDRAGQGTGAMQALPVHEIHVIPGRGHMNAPSHPDYIRHLKAFLAAHDEE